VDALLPRRRDGREPERARPRRPLAAAGRAARDARGVDRGDAAPLAVPLPEVIFERTKEEGRRRLERPLLEVVATALAAGFDIVVGIVTLGLVAASLQHAMGKDAAHVVASLGFGVGLVVTLELVFGLRCGLDMNWSSSAATSSSPPLETCSAASSS
jgi:hypothetical protein